MATTYLTETAPPDEKAESETGAGAEAGGLNEFLHAQTVQRNSIVENQKMMAQIQAQKQRLAQMKVMTELPPVPFSHSSGEDASNMVLRMSQQEQEKSRQSILKQFQALRPKEVMVSPEYAPMRNWIMKGILAAAIGVGLYFGGRWLYNKMGTLLSNLSLPSASSSSSSSSSSDTGSASSTPELTGTAPL